MYLREKCKFYSFELRKFLVDIMSRSVKASVLPTVERLDFSEFTSNQVLTAFPSIALFIPISVLRQYAKPLSLYFLFITGLLFIKQISPWNPLTQLIPVLLVLSISVFRETMQELERQREDKRLNLQKTTVNINGEWTETCWKDVIVGHVVMVSADAPAPADLVMVASSAAGNTAYIQTTNLDGETNFKSRCGVDKAAAAIDKMTSGPGGKDAEQIIIHAEPPRSDLDWFQGEIVYQQGSTSTGQQPPVGNESNTSASSTGSLTVEKLSVRNFIPREAVVRGTDWIIGIVVYTGKDTKVLLGHQRPAYKVSKIDRTTDLLILVILFLQVSLAVFMGVGGALTSSGVPRWWLDPALTASTALRGVFDMLSCIILVTQMIPISLVISLEIAKVYQAKLMEADVEIPGFKAASQALNDDLGQIGYVLSDKTGTLTSNELVLKVATVAGKPFPDLSTLRIAAAANPQVAMFIEALAVCHDISPTWTNVDTVKSARKSIALLRSDAKQRHKLMESSGGVTPVEDLNSGRMKLPLGLSYCGASPDEICLVQACAESLGRVLHKRTHSEMVFSDQRKGEVRYEVARFFEFDNARRRSSIAVWDKDNTSVTIYVKGSDDAVLPRCKAEDDPLVLRETESSLNFYAKQSLRTLVFAYKRMTKTEWSALVAKYDAAKDSAGLIDEVESNLTLLACTGTEDRLQDGVQGSIQRMRTAGIAVWMITGDKLDTATEISKSANLISANMKIVTIDLGDSPSAVAKTDCLVELESELNRVDGPPVAAVVTGRSIRHLAADTRFIQGLLRCQAVVVCRSTKDQKAVMVELVQTAVQKDVLVLAIGDGANDVPMIKKADVGVGIAGKEGRQAAQNADYVITQFSHLDRLLLFHGRLNYVRTSKMVLYFLFKNLVLCLPFIIHAAIVSMYSSSALASETMGLSFNAVLTAFPVFALGLVERDLSPNDHLVSVDGIRSDELAQAYPRLYVTGRKNHMFSRHLLGSMFVAAVIAGCWIYLVTAVPLVSTAINAAGLLADHWTVSDMYFIGVFIVDTVAVILVSDGVTAPMMISVIYSSIGCATFLLSDALDPTTAGGMGHVELMTKSALFLPILLMSVVPPVMAGIAAKSWKYRFDPTARMVWQEAKDRADERRAVLRKVGSSPVHLREQLTNQYKSIINRGASMFYRPEEVDKEFTTPLVARDSN